ncbi:hypothetical protein [Rathayibacter sp. VKM Ac-2928]
MHEHDPGFQAIRDHDADTASSAMETHMS